MKIKRRSLLGSIVSVPFLSFFFGREKESTNLPSEKLLPIARFENGKLVNFSELEKYATSTPPEEVMDKSWVDREDQSFIYCYTYDSVFVNGGGNYTYKGEILLKLIRYEDDFWRNEFSWSYVVHIFRMCKSEMTSCCHNAFIINKDNKHL